jgi:hypothetical protein
MEAELPLRRTLDRKAEYLRRCVDDEAGSGLVLGFEPAGDAGLDRDLALRLRACGHGGAPRRRAGVRVLPDVIRARRRCNRSQHQRLGERKLVADILQCLDVALVAAVRIERDQQRIQPPARDHANVRRRRVHGEHRELEQLGRIRRVLRLARLLTPRIDADAV